MPNATDAKKEKNYAKMFTMKQPFSHIAKQERILLKRPFLHQKSTRKVAKRNPDVGRKGTSTKKDSPIFPQHLSKQGCEKRVKGLQ